MYLRAFVEEVVRDLLEANGVTIHHQRLVRIGVGQRHAVGLRHRLLRFDAAADQRAQIDGRLLQRNLPGGHAGHVQQIVDQPVQMAGLPVDRARVLRQARIVGPLPAQKVVGQEDGGQRISQLVSQHGQELLAPLDGSAGVVLAAPRPQGRAHRRQQRPPAHRADR